MLPKLFGKIQFSCDSHFIRLTFSSKLQTRSVTDFPLAAGYGSSTASPHHCDFLRQSTFTRLAGITAARDRLLAPHNPQMLTSEGSRLRRASAVTKVMADKPARQERLNYGKAELKKAFE